MDRIDNTNHVKKRAPVEEKNDRIFLSEKKLRLASPLSCLDWYHWYESSLKSFEVTMDSLCTVCLAADRNLETISEHRLRLFFNQIVADFSEYEVPQNLPRLCPECVMKLKKAASFKDQVIHSYVILQEIHQQEIVLSSDPLPRKKKVDMTTQTETEEIKPLVDHQLDAQTSLKANPVQDELKTVKKIDQHTFSNQNPYEEKKEGRKTEDSTKLIDIEPQITEHIINKLMKEKLNATTQTKLSFKTIDRALKQNKLAQARINRKSTKQKDISAETEESEVTPKHIMDKTIGWEALEQINKLKIQNQNLLRLLKRLQKDVTNKMDDTSQVSESSQDSSPRKPIRSPRPNVITSPMPKRKCDPNEALNRIKILDVRVLTEEFQIQEPEEGPIVTSTQSLKDVIEIQDSILPTEPLLADEEIVDPGIPLDFYSEEEDACAIADDDQIWENLETDIAYPEIEMKQENEEMDVEGLYHEGREESVTPNTDDLLPDVQSMTDSGSGSESEEENSNKSVLSEYCNKNAVVLLKDIMKDGQSMLTERPRRTKYKIIQTNERKQKKIKNCENCPHCVFMRNKLTESNIANQSEFDTHCYQYKNGKFRKMRERCSNQNVEQKDPNDSRYLFSQTGDYLRRLHRQRSVKCRGRGNPRGTSRGSMVKIPKTAPMAVKGRGRGRGRKRGRRWSESKRVDPNRIKCTHCTEYFDSNEELKRHVFEVIGADSWTESVDGSKVETEVQQTVNVTESSEQSERDKKLLVVVEDVLKMPDTNGRRDEPMDIQEDSLICNHCEKEFKTKKKLRDHILDIALGDCNKSLDDLWQT